MEQLWGEKHTQRQALKRITSRNETLHKAHQTSGWNFQQHRVRQTALTGSLFQPL